MKAKSVWVSFTRGNPCPVCEHGDWCATTSDRAVVMCMRAQSGGILRTDKNGTSFRLFKASECSRRPTISTKPKPKTPRRTLSEWKAIHKLHRDAADDKSVNDLAVELNLTVRSLRLYGIGIDVGGYDGKVGPKGKWFTFPMYDGEGKICGLRTRSTDGQKMSVPGSSNGLFIPNDYSGEAIPAGVCGDQMPLLLLLPEGPTSAAACADMGFRAIGRPNNAAGGSLIAELLSHGDPQDVVIVADDEGTKYQNGVPYWPGWEGSINVARKILAKCGRLRVCRLKDENGKRIKDPRSWLVGRHPLTTILDIFENADDATLEWIEAKTREIELWKQRLKKEIA